MNGYLELEAHPPMIIPYTPKDETAKIYKIPTLMSATTQPSAKGITAQDDKATKQVTIGPVSYTHLTLPTKA